MGTLEMIILIGAFVIFSLIAGLLFAIQQLQKSQESLKKIMKSFERLDEQAKLIVKTDLELNKAQEELDKRLNGLDALQKTSRRITTTLDENEIFQRLDQSLMMNLGFEKNLILIQDKYARLQPRINIGFYEKDIAVIISHIQKNEELLKNLQEGQTFSSGNISHQRKEFINQLFNSDYFILSPILTKNGLIGIIFVGNSAYSSSLTEGDEEIISILANQIGQAIENARLFEEAFRASQILETKVKERTQQLAKALEDVQNISKSKSSFISAVSHELRTPLTSIKGYASILMTGKLGDVPEEVKKRLEKINMHSDNLVQFINNLLDISRIESGRVEMNMTKCNLSIMIESVHDLLTPQLKEKNIEWQAHIDPRIPEMLLDQHQVERIFINLVSNAIKFTPQGGTISINAQMNNNAVTIEVSDTGIGIPEKDLTRLFEEFYRVENEINQNVKGTGLGLSLVRKIVQAHKGKIWVTSQVNKGTTFHFTLPIQQ